MRFEGIEDAWKREVGKLVKGVICWSSSSIEDRGRFARYCCLRVSIVFTSLSVGERPMLLIEAKLARFWSVDK